MNMMNMIQKTSRRPTMNYATRGSGAEVDDRSKSPKPEAFHEAILSYQCVCREEESLQSSNSFDTRLG